MSSSRALLLFPPPMLTHTRAPPRRAFIKLPLISPSASSSSSLSLSPTHFSLYLPSLISGSPSWQCSLMLITCESCLLPPLLLHTTQPYDSLHRENALSDHHDRASARSYCRPVVHEVEAAAGVVVDVVVAYVRVQC